MQECSGNHCSQVWSPEIILWERTRPTEKTKNTTALIYQVQNRGTEQPWACPISPSF